MRRGGGPENFRWLYIFAKGKERRKERGKGRKEENLKDGNFSSKFKIVLKLFLMYKAKS